MKINTEYNFIPEDWKPVNGFHIVRTVSFHNDYVIAKIVVCPNEDKKPQGWLCFFSYTAGHPIGEEVPGLSLVYPYYFIKAEDMLAVFDKDIPIAELLKADA